MKSFIKENTWLRRGTIDFGWGNGYVIIPKDHPLNGKSYCEIHDLIPQLEVNGGLTFSESADDLDWEEIPEKNEGDWIVGFDTAHIWNTQVDWSKYRVQEETERLKEQLQSYGAVS